MKRFGILLFAAVLALGMLLPQAAFATGNHHDKWDSFCKPDKWPEKPFKKWYGGDCDEIFVKVKLPKIWKEIAGEINVEVFWSETGKLKDAQVVKSGTLELATEKEDKFTHKPEKSGYYWFKLSKKGKHKALWTKKIKVDCPDKPGGGQPANRPKMGEAMSSRAATSRMIKTSRMTTRGPRMRTNPARFRTTKADRAVANCPRRPLPIPKACCSADCFSLRERGSWPSVAASPNP